MVNKSSHLPACGKHLLYEISDGKMKFSMTLPTNIYSTVCAETGYFMSLAGYANRHFMQTKSMLLLLLLMISSLMALVLRIVKLLRKLYYEDKPYVLNTDQCDYRELYKTKILGM